MAKPYKIQSPGRYNFPNVLKPVNYSHEFLSNLKLKGHYFVEDEHDGPKLVDVSKIFVQNGELWMEIDDDLDTENRGFSPRIYAECKDMGDYYEAIVGTGVLENGIARTSDPKDISTFLWSSNNQNPIPDNSGNNNTGGDNMGDAETIRALEQEVGSLKTQLNSKVDEVTNLKSQLKDAKQATKDMETSKDDEISKLQSDLTDANKKLGDIDTKQKEKIDALATELAGDDETKLGIYKKLDVEDLLNIRKDQTSSIIKDMVGEDETLEELISKGNYNVADLTALKEKFTTPDTNHSGVGDAGAGDQNNGSSNDGNPDQPPKSFEEWKAERESW
jgi:hypothetical protein